MRPLATIGKKDDIISLEKLIKNRKEHEIVRETAKFIKQDLEEKLYKAKINMWHGRVAPISPTLPPSIVV